MKTSKHVAIAFAWNTWYNSPLRCKMGQAALKEARQRSWPDAMQCLFDGYQEVIMGARSLAAA